MLLRRILPLLAVLGLLFAGPHAAAMAMPMATQAVSVVTDESPCHAQAAAETPAKVPDKPACCADGCVGQCAPILAFLSVSPALNSKSASVLVSVELRAPAPDSAPFGQDRPPRSAA